MKTIFKLFIVGILGASVYFAYQGYEFAVVPRSFTQASINIDIPPGSSFGSLRSKLMQEGVPVDPLLFRVWRRLKTQNRALKAGEYTVESGQSTYAILEKIMTASPKLYSFTIKEGENVYDFLKTVETLNLADTEKSKFPALLKDPSFLKNVGIYPSSTDADRYWLEGFLFPETYTYQKYDSAEKIVNHILTEFKSRIVPLLKGHSWTENPEGKFKVLTLAAMVEKESGLFDEQPLIASVFWNRVAKRMRFQSDPTTIYGLLPNFDGNLKRVHLTTPSPYNTYTLDFLPRGPIANPGAKAVEAVLKPATSDYLYFVARGDGTHVFSRDLKTHNYYVREYQILRRGKKTN
jgi:UPF0755 protein